MQYWIVPSIILGIGFIICLGLILRSHFLQTRKNIDDYQEGRDKLTFRKKKEVASSSGGMLGNLIGGFVVILVGFTLLPEINKQVNIASNATNLMGASNTLLTIVPIFFAIAICGAAIAMVAGSLRNGGII